jgi:hypothetical protein
MGMTDRADIPATLLEQARTLGPSVLAALLASYPTDEEHARMVNERERKRRQLELRFARAA